MSSPVSLSGSPSLPRPRSLTAAEAPDAQQIVTRLGEQIRGIQAHIRRTGPVISSGSSALDGCLPQGGFLGGTILELTTPRGLPVGATSIALRIAKHAIQPEPTSALPPTSKPATGSLATSNPSTAGKYVVLIEPPTPYYPPALEHLGLPLERVIGLRPANYADLLWSLDQALRCPAVGCVIANVDRLDDRAARRLQLATETGGGLAILVRPAVNARNERSWADVQWYVSSEAPTPFSSTRWFRMTLKRCSGGRAGARLRIGIGAHGEWIESDGREVGNAKTNHVPLAAELAKPARVRREAAG